MITVTIHTQTENFSAQGDQIFETVIRQSGTRVHAPCGGRGTCGKCRAALFDPDHTLTEAAPLPQPEADELTKRYALPGHYTGQVKEVLLCRLTPTGTEGRTPEIFLPPHGEISVFAKEQTDLDPDTVDFHPVVERRIVTLDRPTKEKPISTAENIAKHTGIVCKNHAIIEKTGALLRDGQFELTFDLAADGDSSPVLLDVTAEPDAPVYGAAIDIGTTTLAVSLWNLSTGARVDARTTENPQRSFGADVISRMSYAEEAPEHRALLKETITRRIAELMRTLAEGNGIDKNRILYTAVAGNSVMEHLALGLETRGIARSPFVMETPLGYPVAPAELGLNPAMNENGIVFPAPLIASYVGGDLSFGAAYLLRRLRKEGKAEGNILFLDLGTNGEMGLFSKGAYRFAATAAGPCLEGANIEMGMCAAPGAIHKVRFTGDGFDTAMIGEGTPRGICGSGIIDGTAALLESGILDEYGSLAEEDELDAPLALWFTEYGDDKTPAVRLTSDQNGALTNHVVLTAGDIRQVQTAKAAISAGVAILLRQAQLTADQLDGVYLAGSFGGGINVDSAVKIGLLPETDCTPESLGNTSLNGAAAYLFDAGFRRELADVMARAEYTELSAHPQFNDIFIDSMLFGSEELL